MLLRKEPVISDPCQVSVDILRRRALEYLKSGFDARHVWFADHFKDLPEVKDGQIIDVVFFGSFVRRFLESGNWPVGRYRFWCLTGSVKSAMSSLLGIPQEAIGVIPRTGIFEAPKKVASLPKTTTPMTFVFGGRLSATKNLELVVRTVHTLQTKHGLDVSLVLSGDFDDRNHPDRGIWEGESFAAKLKTLVVGLEWKKKPVFKHGLGPMNWTRQKYVNPIYVNFSTYLFEDFDVSLAQAQEAGWPAIVSEWGGHRDVSASPSVIKIHPATIGHAHEIQELTALRAEAVANWIHANLKTPPKTVPSRAPQSEDPKILLTDEIDRIRRLFLKKLGPGGLTLQRRGLDGFSYEDVSEKFFATYRACFAGAIQGPATAVLVNDLHSSEDETIANIPRVCESILRDSSRAKSQVVFVPAKEALQPMHTFVFARADEILVPFESKHVTPLVRHWRRDLEVSGRIMTVQAKKRGGKSLAFTEVRG